MKFNWAIEMLDGVGAKVCRTGWNGKGMYVVKQHGYITDGPEETKVKCLPYLMMKTVDGSFVPWVASQTDLLCNDWEEFQE